MNPEIKAEWVKRLRSGDIPQITDRLAERSGGPGRCCLGVLCDIAAEAGVVVKDGGRRDNDHYSQNLHTTHYRAADGRLNQDGLRDESYTSLPEAVMEWAGLESNLSSEVNIPISTPSPYGQRYRPLSAFNDSGDYDFKAIADIIERAL